MNIGNNIKNIRNEKKMTLKQVADKMDCSPQNIAQYENGKRIPKIDTIKKLAAALDVSLNELMNTAENLVETSAFTLANTAENFRETISDFSNGMQILPKDEQTLISDYHKLNNTGKKEARKRVNELTEIPRYTNKDVQQPDNKD